MNREQRKEESNSVQDVAKDVARGKLERTKVRNADCARPMRFLSFPPFSVFCVVCPLLPLANPHWAALTSNRVQ